MVWVPLHSIGGPARRHPVGRVDPSPRRRARSACRTRPPPRGSAPPAAGGARHAQTRSVGHGRIPQRALFEQKASAVGTAGVRLTPSVARPCVNTADARREPLPQMRGERGRRRPCSVREQPPTHTDSNQERTPHSREIPRSCRHVLVAVSIPARLWNFRGGRETLTRRSGTSGAPP
jgi:hypothetical protein